MLSPYWIHVYNGKSTTKLEGWNMSNSTVRLLNWWSSFTDSMNFSRQFLQHQNYTYSRSDSRPYGGALRNWRASFLYNRQVIRVWPLQNRKGGVRGAQKVGASRCRKLGHAKQCYTIRRHALNTCRRDQKAAAHLSSDDKKEVLSSPLIGREILSRIAKFLRLILLHQVVALSWSKHDIDHTTSNRKPTW
jgi:hypothetical protein